MVSVVSSSVRPSLSSGKASSTTSSTKAPAAISPAISPTDTRAPVRVLDSDRRGRSGVVTVVAGTDGRPVAAGRSASPADDGTQLGQPFTDPGLGSPAGRPVVVLADQRV